MNLLDHHATLKKKTSRANNAPYITKKLRKAIMKRSQLENVYSKTLTEKRIKAYKKQKSDVIVGCIKKKEKCSLIVYIHQLFQIIKSFGKL